jgi:chromosome segregation ATPase
LFGLGFLSAALLAMLITPAVHRRVVRYTENRIKATMPISPAEVRAQKDMARAVYAAENARTKQDLISERDKTLALKLRHEHLANETSRALSESQELHIQINDMNVEAADLRSKLRREDAAIGQLKAALDSSEDRIASRERRIDELQRNLNKLAADMDDMRIDLATSETEVENFRFRVNALRDERDTLRGDLKLTTTRAKDAEHHLSSEQHRLLRLEEKLARELADRADHETALERRVQEIGRLKEKLKTAQAETREATKALRAAGITKPIAFIRLNTKKTVMATTDVDSDGISASETDRAHEVTPMSDQEIAQLQEELRNRSTALSERLMTLKDGTQDEVLREEMATISAKMVALTAAVEGPASPIHAILAPKPIGRTRRNRISLAERAQQIMPRPDDVAPDAR